MLSLLCYDENYNLVEKTFENNNFRTYATFFNNPEDIIALPVSEHHASLFIKYLNTKQIPEQIKDIKEIVNIARFSHLKVEGNFGVTFLNFQIRKKISEQYSIKWIDLNNFLKIYLANTDIKSYDVTYFILDNTDKLIHFIQNKSIA